MLAIATLKGYRKVLEGKETVPDEDDDLDTTLYNAAEIKKLTAARKFNTLGYNKLLLSCQDKISFGLVDEGITDELPSGALCLAWKDLNGEI